MMQKVFVYGTLKKGFRNNSLLNGHFLGKAFVNSNCFELYEVTKYNYPFPALVESKEVKDFHVYGELYEVTEDCLCDLDTLEGVSSGLYERKLISVLTEDGQEHKNVIAYTYCRLDGFDKYIGNVWPLSENDRLHFAGFDLYKEDDHYLLKNLYSKKQYKFLKIEDLKEDVNDVYFYDKFSFETMKKQISD